MKAVLLDTHAWAWSLAGDARLSALAVKTMEGAGTVMVSAISVFEIGQKVRLGKWPEMEPFLDRLPELIEAQGGVPLSLTPEICLGAAKLDWAHRDPFDRMLAAMALRHRLALVSTDEVFDELKGRDGWVGRVW